MSDKSTSGGAVEGSPARVTDKPFKGFYSGLIVTCMIQSSTAAIITHCRSCWSRFPDIQAVDWDVLGANVGTTITAQIIRWWTLSRVYKVSCLSKSDNLAPMALVIGIVLIMFVSSSRALQWEPFLWGFGTLSWALWTWVQRFLIWVIRSVNCSFLSKSPALGFSQVY